jgi:hypothetical protein
MQDWGKYIERPIVEVLPELEAEGYRVTSDECAIFGFRNIDIVKGDVVAEIVCIPYNYEEYENGDVTAEDADWWVEDVFENEESYLETNG